MINNVNNDLPGAMRGLQGKRAIVTGASSGIGLGIATRLAEEKVDQVIVAGPGEDAEIEAVAEQLRAAGVTVSSVSLDIGSPDSAPRLLAMAVEELGGLDLIVNNAGIAPCGAIVDAPLTDFDAVMHVNVRGVYLLAQEAARHFIVQRSGAMCFTASVAGTTGEESMAAYNASKAAVGSLARSVALDLAPYGVRVNAVAPGWVRTAATDEIITTSPDWRKHRARIPMDRAAETSEIAAAVAFLLSDDASYLTGSILVVDGGQSAGFRWSGWDAVDPRTDE